MATNEIWTHKLTNQLSGFWAFIFSIFTLFRHQPIFLRNLNKILSQNTHTHLRFVIFKRFWILGAYGSSIRMKGSRTR